MPALINVYSFDKLVILWPVHDGGVYLCGWLRIGTLGYLSWLVAWWSIVTKLTKRIRSPGSREEQFPGWKSVIGKPDSPRCPQRWTGAPCIRGLQNIKYAGPFHLCRPRSGQRLWPGPQTIYGQVSPKKEIWRMLVWNMLVRYSRRRATLASRVLVVFALTTYRPRQNISEIYHGPALGIASLSAGEMHLTWTAFVNLKSDKVVSQATWTYSDSPSVSNFFSWGDLGTGSVHPSGPQDLNKFGDAGVGLAIRTIPPRLKGFNFSCPKPIESFSTHSQEHLP